MIRYVSIVATIANDLCPRLVAAGLGVVLGTSIASASNATPIVVQTTTPHNIPVNTLAFIDISGVAGNTAANGDFAAQVAEDGSLALYELSFDSNAGIVLTPVAGSGAYTGGGVLQAALPDGTVLLGREWVVQGSAPPRIVMVPTGFKARTGAQEKSGTSISDSNYKRRLQQRTLGTKVVDFEVHVWGQAIPPDRGYDFEATDALVEGFWETLHTQFVGRYMVTDGKMMDQVDGAVQKMKQGHYCRFGCTLETPVLDKLLTFAPSSVRPTGEVFLDGTLGFTFP